MNNIHNVSLSYDEKPKCLFFKIANIAKDVGKFALRLLKPSPNTLRVRWYLNDVLLSANVDSIYLNKGVLNKGINVLKAEVKDTTDLVRKPGYENNIFAQEWQIQADKIFDLDIPVSTWGDTLETCFDGYQALSVKNPQAGLVYKWFDNKESVDPIAVGYNMVTPRLNKDKTYYVSASFGHKITEKKAVFLKILPKIERPKSIKVDLKQGKYTIVVGKEVVDKYNLNWYLKPEGPLRGGRSRNLIEISQKDAPSKIYLELIDKVSTCKSEKFEIKLH